MMRWACWAVVLVAAAGLAWTPPELQCLDPEEAVEATGNFPDERTRSHDYIYWCKDCVNSCEWYEAQYTVKDDHWTSYCEGVPEDDGCGPEQVTEDCCWFAGSDPC